MARPSLKPFDVAAALGVGAGAALVFGVVLASLATPNDFEARLGALTGAADRSETLLKPVRDRGPFGAEALCSRDPMTQANDLRERVSAQVTQAGLVLDSLETRVEPTPDADTRVVPVRLRFSVTGPYEGAIGVLALLSRERPQLFVDSLDLTPKVSSVTLSFSGRVFCGV